MAEKNTFNLPRGDAIRLAMRDVFRTQRLQVLGALRPGRKDRAADDGLPDEAPELELGALKISERMTPKVSVLWEQGGRKLFGRVGLDPDRWQVVNPHTEGKIRQAALDFCTATNATTSLKLGAALARTREELVAGVVTRGESVAALATRVNGVFDHAEKWRARAIAQTEASRAVHAATEAAAVQSGMVAGWEWLLSGDACPLCQTLGRRAKFVKLGDPFAVIGDHPAYSEVRYPPGHPHCNCSMIEVLKPEYGGPENVAWSPTLLQPKPEAEDHPGGLPPASKPKPGPKPKPPSAPPALPPGTPVLPGRPVAERLKAYTEGDAKVKAILALGEKSDAELARLLALRKAHVDAFVAADREHTALALRGRLKPAELERARDLEAAMRAAKAEITRIKGEAEGVRESARAGVVAALKVDSPAVLAYHPEAPLAPALEENVRKARAFLEPITRRADRAYLTTSVAQIPAEGEQRAYYQTKAGRIHLSALNGPGVVVHESGHMLEALVTTAGSPLWKSELEFLAYRVGDEAPVKLAEKFPGAHFKPWEFGRKDRFDEVFDEVRAYYTGKDYGDGGEVLSLGVEQLYSDAAHFARKDPEYLKWVLGALDGRLR